MEQNKEIHLSLLNKDLNLELLALSNIVQEETLLLGSLKRQMDTQLLVS